FSSSYAHPPLLHSFPTRRSSDLHRQFVRRQPQRLPRDRFRQTIQFKQNVSRFHRRDPKLRLTFSLTHSRFRRTRGHGFIRENPEDRKSTRRTPVTVKSRMPSSA